jgi:hypothetical protein
VNVEAEEPASIELAPAHPTIEIQCVFQRKQILPFTRACCMIMVRAHLAAFSKVVLRPNGNIVRVLARAAKKDVNPRQQIEAGHQLIAFSSAEQGSFPVLRRLIFLTMN